MNGEREEWDLWEGRGAFKWMESMSKCAKCRVDTPLRNGYAR